MFRSARIDDGEETMMFEWKRRLIVLLIGLSCLVTAAIARADENEGEATTARSSLGENREVTWFWLDADAGIQSLNLRTFTADAETFSAGIVPTYATGPVAEVGAGVRLLFFTLGAKMRVGMFEDDGNLASRRDWQLWSIDAEAGFRFPLDRFEPYLTLGAGYTTIGNLDTAIEGLGRGLDVDGANLRAVIGFDYFVTPWLTLGASAGGDLLFMSRKGVPVRDLLEAKPVNTINEAQARVLEGDGSSIGTALMITGGAGLHF